MPRGRLRGRGLTSPCPCAGVDDAESECGLDNFGAFDWVLENHGDERRLEEQLENLVAFVQSRRPCRVPGAADVWSPTPAEGPADA